MGWHDPDGSGRGSGGGPGSWEGQGPRSKNPSAAQRPWVLLSGAAGSRSIGASGAVGAVGGVAGGPRTLLSWRGCQVGSLPCGWERTPCAHSGASEVTSPVWSLAAARQPRRAACPVRREWPGHRGWRDRPDRDRRRPALRPTRHSGRAKLSVAVACGRSAVRFQSGRSGTPLEPRAVGRTAVPGGFAGRLPRSPGPNAARYQVTDSRSSDGLAPPPPDRVGQGARQPGSRPLGWRFSGPGWGIVPVDMMELNVITWLDDVATLVAGRTRDHAVAIVNAHQP